MLCDKGGVQASGSPVRFAPRADDPALGVQCLMLREVDEVECSHVFHDFVEDRRASSEDGGLAENLTPLDTGGSLIGLPLPTMSQVVAVCRQVHLHPLGRPPDFS